MNKGPPPQTQRAIAPQKHGCHCFMGMERRGASDSDGLVLALALALALALVEVRAPSRSLGYVLHGTWLTQLSYF